MPISLEVLGQKALKKGHYQEAVNIFKRLLDNNKSVFGWMGLGQAYEGLQEYLTARWAYYKALEMEPVNHSAVQATNRIGIVIASSYNQQQYKRREVNFRALRDAFDQRTENGWRPMFIKGVNLGLGIPGFFPGEYPIGKKTYSRWFELMSATGINAVRVYAIQSPSFYEALYEHNKNKGNLLLLQGIWAELPDDNNFSNEQYFGNIRRHIGEVVDAVFGSTSLPERPGFPHGAYTCDVSPYTLGFIFGREWEKCAVEGYNKIQGNVTRDHSGVFLSITQGTAFEAWVVQAVDFLLKYENDRYGVTGVHGMLAHTGSPCSSIRINIRRRAPQTRVEREDF